MARSSTPKTSGEPPRTLGSVHRAHRAHTSALPARTAGRGSLACVAAGWEVLGRAAVDRTLCALIAEMHARTRLGAAQDVVLNIRLNGVVRGTFNVSRTGERCHERLHASVRVRVRVCLCARVCE
jgi:hypothetical protein